MKREKMGTWVLVIIMILCMLSVLIYCSIMFLRVTKTINFCERRGYEGYDIVGDKFNCCNKVTLIEQSNTTPFYKEKTECIAGGTYPIK